MYTFCELPGGGFPEYLIYAPVWINEIHYDNVGSDLDEGIEIAGSPASPSAA